MDDVLIVLPQAESTTSDYVTTNDVNTVLPQTPKHVDEDNFVFSKLNGCRIKPNSMVARLVATLQAAQSIVRFIVSDIYIDILLNSTLLTFH